MRVVGSAFSAGLLFAFGLVVSGMTRPEKVLGFLDLAHWDPSLAMVMVGGIGVNAVFWFFTKRRARPLNDDRFHLPTQTKIDGRLILGSAIFGVGRGVAGYCPGPSVVALGGGSLGSIVFFAAMVAGMLAWLPFKGVSAPARRRDAV